VVAELNRDVFLGKVCAFAGAVEKTSTLTLDELRRTILIAEEIARRQPFQLSQMMPKDCPHLVKCEGKYYFGRSRWREFNDALATSESRAMALLLEWKVLDLDAASAAHRLKWGKEQII
jgi:hypothetical protein